MDIGIKIVIAVVVILVLIGIKMVCDEKARRKRMREFLINSWGKSADRNYSEEQWNAIVSYYKVLEKKTEESQKHEFVDDITWNDLDMDEVYQVWNHTRTSIGEEYLYAALRHPIASDAEMEERERVITYLLENTQERMYLQEAFAEIGKLERMSVYDHLELIQDMKPIGALPHILAGVCLVGALIGCAFAPEFMVIVSIAIMGGNIISYYQAKAKVDSYIRMFTFILHMVEQCEGVARKTIPGLEKYQDQLKKQTSCFGKYRRFCFLVNGGSGMSGDIMDSLMDYIRILFHVDLVKMSTMIREAKKYEQQLRIMYDTIGYLDTMLSTASCRIMYGEYCVPQLSHQANGKFAVTEMYHPLIPEGVRNSITAERSVLLTGSNASGKSTFIKTVALNAILAQTLHTVLAENYQASWFCIASSMALRDDILSQESYYIVEIRSLKRILDLTRLSELPVLCFIDEVLRGTNTVERIAASSRILQAIAEQGGLCFAATHDIELTYLLEKEYDNYHFEEQVEDDKVTFDYCLREGRACTRNAIRLLKMLGYDEKIVDDANERVALFLKSGNWVSSH